MSGKLDNEREWGDYCSVTWNNIYWKSTLPSFAKKISLLIIQIQDTTVFIVLNIKSNENVRTIKIYIFHFPLFYRYKYPLAKHCVKDCLKSHSKPDCLKPAWEHNETNINPSTFHYTKLISQPQYLLHKHTRFETPLWAS